MPAGALELCGIQQPAKKMKMSDDFLVPLSKQVVSLLRELHPVTCDDKRGRVFLGVKPGKSLSENTPNSAIRAMGYTKEQHCSHGFRGTASSPLRLSTISSVKAGARLKLRVH